MYDYVCIYVYTYAHVSEKKVMIVLYGVFFCYI